MIPVETKELVVQLARGGFSLETMRGVQFEQLISMSAAISRDTLRAMVACCLPSVNTMQVDGRVNVALSLDLIELLSFLKRNFLPTNLTCERAAVPERGIYDRTKAVFEYFGVPFEAEPPDADYVAPQTVLRQPKIGRNDPCLCGSGKKYKKCCGRG